MVGWSLQEERHEQIKCYKCGEYGHYANKCPKKDVESGLFVGMAVQDKAGANGKLRTFPEMKKRHSEFQEENKEMIMREKRLKQYAARSNGWQVCC